MNSTEEDRVELVLDDELFRFNNPPGDLFHKFRVNDNSDLVGGWYGGLVVSQLAINEDKTPSLIKL